MQIGRERPSVNRKLCFVLMPFRTDLDPVYRTIRDAAVLDSGLTCERADDIYSAGIIIDEVWGRICEAHIVVADATGKNANVFYEMGLAHAVEKNIVILAQSTSDIPFDLQHRRTIFYKPDRLDELRIKLTATIERLRWRPPDIKQWVETSDGAIRVGLAFPVDGTVVDYTPVESAGLIVGLGAQSLRHRIQAWVRTDREYQQDSAWIDDDGSWVLRRVHLGTHRHRVSFRIYDESGRTVAVSKPITVTVEDPKPGTG